VPSHEQFMQKALALAARGAGSTSPNPLVGCVVVRDDHIIGEGWHEQYAQAHAEVNAMRDAGQNGASDAATLAGCTLYVTLEPCNHHGMTPPCTQAILDSGVTRVVYALKDPNPKAAGGGRFLRDEGLDVIGGVLQEQAALQNRFFLKHVLTRKPFVIAKSASSLDGRVCTRGGYSQWITGPEARVRAHELRQQVDAIVVGANTVESDDPALTVRLPQHTSDGSNRNEKNRADMPVNSAVKSHKTFSDNPEYAPVNAAATAPDTPHIDPSYCHIRHPRPVILDTHGRVPLDSQLLSADALPTRSIVATSPLMDTNHRHLLEGRGIEVLTLPLNEQGEGIDPSALLAALGQRGIQSLLLEGGPAVHGSFRDAGLIDEVWAFIAPTLIGGTDAHPSYTGIGSQSLDDATRLHRVEIETLGNDFLLKGIVIGNAHGLDEAMVEPQDDESRVESRVELSDEPQTLARQAEPANVEPQKHDNLHLSGTSDVPASPT